MSELISHGGKNETYEQFEEKFKPKKTTDDCFTPVATFEVVRNWVCNEYGIDPESIVRPFWPGGDYENFEYPEGCVVLDNPPFSILTKIVRFYYDKGIKFFLFCPALTQFSMTPELDICRLVLNNQVIYENGANVATSFVTNMETPGIRSAPILYKAIKDVQPKKPEIPKYEYPGNVVTFSRISKLSKNGIEYKIPAEKLEHIRGLHSQKIYKKTIYGNGYLTSDFYTKELEAKELEAKELVAKEKFKVWELSDIEKEIIKKLGES